MRNFRALLLLFLFGICDRAATGSTSPKIQDDPGSPLYRSAFAALANVVLAQEYLQVQDQPFADANSRQMHLRQQQALGDFLEAHRSALDAAVRKQTLPQADRLSKLLADHQQLLMQASILPKDWQKLSRDDLINRIKLSPDSASQALFHQFLASVRQAKDEPCKILEKLPGMFVKHQESLLIGSTVTDSKQLASFVSGWIPEKTQCLVWQLWRLHQQHPTPANDPLPLLLALAQAQPQVAQLAVLQAVLALRHLENQNFAEALRTLFDLQENASVLRPLYERTQRAFSYYQKGSGEVVLKN